MDLAQKYTELTGFSINTNNQARIYAAIEKVQYILEDLLGYTLNEDERTTNYIPSLTPTTAYRLFPVRFNDVNHHIDPATAITTIKLMKNGAVEDTIESTEYTAINDRGFYKYFVINQALTLNRVWYPFKKIIVCADDYYEWGVDAIWCHATDLPNSLMSVFADMVTFYARTNKEIKSETLGSHSYTKFDQKAPEEIEMNRKIITRFAGPKGSINKNPLF